MRRVESVERWLREPWFAGFREAAGRGFDEDVGVLPRGVADVACAVPGAAAMVGALGKAAVLSFLVALS